MVGLMKKKFDCNFDTPVAITYGFKQSAKPPLKYGCVLLDWSVVGKGLNTYW